MVSCAFHTFDDEFQAWQARPLPPRDCYVFADGTYFSVIYNGQGWEACLTFYAYPEGHWVNIRTSNISCLLLFYAVIRTLQLRKIRMPG